MPLVVHRSRKEARPLRSVNPTELLLTRLAFGIMAAIAAGSAAWSLAGQVPGIIAIIIGFCVGFYKASQETETRYGSLLESILTRLVFGMIAGAVGGLAGWFWSGFSRKTGILNAGIGFLVGLLLGDRIPEEWLRPW